MTLRVGGGSGHVWVVSGIKFLFSFVLGHGSFATTDDSFGGDRVFLAGGGTLSCRSAFLWGSSNTLIGRWRKVCWALYSVLTKL